MEMLQTAESVMPVTTFPYPVLRSLSIRKTARSATNGPNMQPPEVRIWKRSTMTAGSFMPAGRTLFPGGNNGYARHDPASFPEMEVQDIDTEEDWAVAEVKYQKMLEKQTHE